MKADKKEAKIKALIFDMGGVIVFYDHMIAARKMSKIINVPTKKIFKVLNDNSSKFTISTEGGDPPKIYWNVLAKEVGANKIPVKKFNKLWNTMFWSNKKMISFVKNIKRKYKIGLISNINLSQKRYVSKKYKLNKIFPVRVYSYKIKARKPSSKIYRTALKKLKVKPEESIFIDDKPENIKGAEKLGMCGIYFKNNKQTFKELEKLGVI